MSFCWSCNVRLSTSLLADDSFCSQAFLSSRVASSNFCVSRNTLSWSSSSRDRSSSCHLQHYSTVCTQVSKKSQNVYTAGRIHVRAITTNILATSGLEKASPTAAALGTMPVRAGLACSTAHLTANTQISSSPHYNIDYLTLSMLYSFVP